MRDAVGITGFVSMTVGIGMLSIPWMLIISGSILFFASIIGLFIKQDWKI